MANNETTPVQTAPVQEKEAERNEFGKWESSAQTSARWEREAARERSTWG